MKVSASRWKMHFDLCEPCRTIKRGIDGYISSRKAFMFVIIFMGLLLYIGPSIFHWLWNRAPAMLDSNIDCVEGHISKLLPSDNFDASVSRSYGHSEKGYVPYVGNGKIGLSIIDNALFVLWRRSLSLKLQYHPIVETDIPDSNRQEAVGIHFARGVAYRMQCFSLQHGSVSVIHHFFTHRTLPSLFVQVIEIVNLSNMPVTVYLKRNSPDQVLQNMEIRHGDGSTWLYHQSSGYIEVPDSNLHVGFSISSVTVPVSVTINAKRSETLIFRTVVHYSSPVHLSEYRNIVKKLENSVHQDLLKIVEYSVEDLKKKHSDVWEKIWHSGFSISFSRAQKALNGDKINATLYYVLSNAREYLSEVGTSSQYRSLLQRYLYEPDKCYGGHHTLQASTLWSDLKTIDDVNSVVSLWLLTLNKQGCHNLVQAGASGVMQAMVLSFGGFKFSNHHLEFDCDPKDLHRDYHFRRVIYGNSTHINISVIVQEDNKALIYATLDRSDKDYYGCDAGCLGMPVRLGSEPVQFPVKITNPLTSVLYITSDKEHMEELKHAIHIKGVIEAPAHEHHIIALHRHGHQLGGLPTFFWVSVAFLIAVFHLFLVKLIYNEYCGSDDKTRMRYLV